MTHASGWYRILSPSSRANRLMGNHEADWVIVGAGITGLMATRRLAEMKPNARILLLDAYRIGYGASGRNAGFIIDTPHLSESLTLEQNLCQSRLIIYGLNKLTRYVNDYKLNCNWSRKGHLTAIVNPGRTQKLLKTANMLEAIGEKYTWLERAEIEHEIGSSHYHAAILTPGTVFVNPAALCKELATIMPDNVKIFEDTPVLSMQSGSKHVLECPEGTIKSKNILLTTNAFITKLGFLKSKK